MAQLGVDLAQLGVALVEKHFHVHCVVFVDVVAVDVLREQSHLL